MSDYPDSNYSAFGEHFCRPAPILSLMQDLGDALNNNPEMLFLGGGNPALIPGAMDCFQKHVQTLGQDREGLSALLGVYQSPQGDEQTLADLSDYFCKQYNWSITTKNIALVGGSQTAFFILLNMFAGETTQGGLQKILLPLVPEYLGYASQVPAPGVFETHRPDIVETAPGRFKYRLASGSLAISNDIGAMLCSRPTNPTGNVLTDDETRFLSDRAKKNHIPLILDNAYGHPFPNLLSIDIKPFWDDNVIQVFSLSKLGLPGLRTAVVVANPERIEHIVRANTVLNLATSNMGARMLSGLIRSGDMQTLSQDILPNYYAGHRKALLHYLDAGLKNIDYKIHEAEGAFFLWLWLPQLGVDSDILYEHLKAKRVLVMSGTPFFFDQQGWDHAKQCLRLSYCQPIPVLKAAALIIAETICELK